MPKLNNRPPKYSKFKKYAVIYYCGKTHYLGLYGSPESKIAYSRLIAEIQANPVFFLPKGEPCVTVKELAAAFLDHAKTNMDATIYGRFRIIVLEFLMKLYGDNTPVDSFTPRSLKLVREEMVNSSRFCRDTINRHVRRIVSIFEWGVENDLVPETAWNALKAVKSLPKGSLGTFDHEERQPVSDDVIRRTLPFMPPTLRVMVQLQRLLGMRPNEIFKMRVGDIDTTRDNGLWYYIPGSYKTAKFVGKIVFPLGKPEQELIATYLTNKKPDAAVFSPRTAQEERKSEKRANRKTKITPSQAARDKERATKPFRYAEFYNRDSYRQAIEYAIDKGNKALPADQKIPHWTPYQIRHTAATATELEIGLDASQALLAHKTANMTRRYSKAQLEKREELARQRRNPFFSETPHPQ